MMSSCWNELRLNNQVCDGVLTTPDGTKFNIHRLILSSFSPYFRAYFTNCLNNGGPEISEMSITDVPPAILSNIIEFAYTGNCQTTMRNVHALMVASDRLSCVPIVDHCCSFIAKNLTPDNCIFNWRFARTYNNRGLEMKAWLYICQEILQVIQSTLFLKLTAKEVKELLSSDELNVKFEHTVFDAITCWTAVNPDSRKLHFADLLTCVRFGLLPIDYYYVVIKRSKYHTKESLELLSAIDVLLESEGDSSNFRYCYFRPRVPNEVIFAIGGWSEGNPIDLVETYDKRSDQWYVTNIQDQIRAYHGAVVIDNKIYVVGGFNSVDFFSTLYMFDPVTYQWSEKACMHDVRCYVSVCEYRGEIYAFGGFNGRNRLNSAEKYNPSRNQWTLIRPMRNLRSDANAAVCNGRIYVVGGFNGQDVMGSVEMYNVDCDLWEYAVTMNSPRSGISLITHGHYMYAIGGFDGVSRLRTVERYNSELNIWERMADMLSVRSNMASVIMDNCIFVMGGFNGQTTISDCEKYDLEQNRWYESASMNVNRSALAVCICRGLPNTRSYTYLGSTGDTTASGQTVLLGDNQLANCRL